MDLFKPFEPLQLRNRSVMPAMTRYACDALGVPTKELGAYYVRRAECGVGLIIVEGCAINGTDAMGYIGGAQFHHLSHVEAWKPIVEAVHQAGSKIWIQLFHAGRLTVPEISRCSPLAPSAILPFSGPSYWRPEVDRVIVNFQTKTPYITVEEMSRPKIENTIDQFVNSCTLAVESGFDGVELHGAHGYLLHEFCSALTNKREDEYGPSPDFKFVNDLTIKCRQALTSKVTLSYRMSLHMVDNTFIRFEENELDYKGLTSVLEKNGVDVFHSSEISAGSPMFGTDRSLGECIRSVSQKPIIVCGKVEKKGHIRQLLNEKKFDLIAFGRNLIGNPDLILKYQKDIEDEIEIVPFDHGTHLAEVY